MRSYFSSKAVYVIVGVLLTVFLVGGVFYSQYRASDMRSGQDIASTDTTQSQSEVSQDEGNQPEESEPIESSGSSSAMPEELPVTGVVNTSAFNLVVVYLLVFVVTEYIVSLSRVSNRF